MPITGSDLALMQCRSGIARSGATRSNYHYGNAVILINGVNRTSSIQEGTLRIFLALNDEPDTASFTLVPGATIPAVGEPVLISLGAAGNEEFGGQVEAVSYQRVRGLSPQPFYVVTCRDWARMFDRRTVTTAWTSQTADIIVADIIANYTSGFTFLNVASGLATIDYFPATNAKPSSLLTRLANFLGNGAGWYIDPDRDVHFFGAGGETGTRAPTAPLTLTHTASLLQQMRHTLDVQQIRTKVIVEGKRSTCPLSIPAGVTLPGIATLPVVDSSIFNVAGGVARIGSQRVTYTSRNYPVTYGNNAEGARVTANAATGATAVTINDTAWVLSTGTAWCQIGDQIIHFGGSNGAVPEINAIPASGFGSIAHPIGVGESVRALGMLVGVSGLTLAQELDVEVVLRVEVTDAAAAAARAAVEGGDGIAEHIIVDGRLDEAGATERANAELAAFGAPNTHASWVTRDFNAKPGRPQVINLTGTGGLSQTLTITRVEETFPIPHRAPVRRCEAEDVKTSHVRDVMVSEQD